MTVNGVDPGLGLQKIYSNVQANLTPFTLHATTLIVCRLLIAAPQRLHDIATAPAPIRVLALVAINTYNVRGHAISPAASPAPLSGTNYQLTLIQTCQASLSPSPGLYRTAGDISFDQADDTHGITHSERSARAKPVSRLTVNNSIAK